MEVVLTPQIAFGIAKTALDLNILGSTRTEYAFLSCAVEENAAPSGTPDEKKERDQIRHPNRVSVYAAGVKLS